MDTIALLPLGAHEYHGPHLPLETDTIIVNGFRDLLKKNLPPHFCVSFLPTQNIGYSIEHLCAPGTKSLPYDQAIESWIKIGQHCCAQGIRKMLIFNAHGGNSPLMTLVATELRARHNMLCVTTSWPRLGLPAGLISAEEKALDIHGGLLETSLMLALAPEKVQRDRCKNFFNQQQNFSEQFTYLRAYGPHAFGWLMKDLNPEGAAGNALKASAEIGKSILNHGVKELLKLLEDIAAFDLGLFAPPPAPN